MSRDGIHAFWTGLLVVTSLTAGPFVHADEPKAPPGYKIVQVPMGGSTVPVMVKLQSDPFKNVTGNGSSGKYDPQRLFSASSPMADKKFAYPSADLGQRNASAQPTFVTKNYEDPSTAASGSHFDTKTSYPTSSKYTQSASGTDRAFPTAVSGDQSRSFATASAESYQNRTAPVGNHDRNEGLAYAGTSQYIGPGAQHVPADLQIKDNVIISRMSGLPNRSLSIDEVRDLINHGAKAHTDEQPPEPTKPLNDPDFQPTPLRATPARPIEEENESVPGPGMIAAPETAEPLPQK